MPDHYDEEEKDYERNRRENRPDLKPTDFVERYKKNELGKESIDAMINGIADDWNNLDPRVKDFVSGTAKVIGDTYQDMRTISEEERLTYDPVKKVNAYATAGIVRGFELGGELLDATVGNVGRGIGWMAGLDPRAGEALAIGAQFAVTPKLPKAAKAFSKTQMARNMAMDAGMTMGAQYQFGKQTVKAVKKGFKNIKKGYTENFSKDASQRVVNVVGEAIDSDSASFRDVYSLAQSINRKTDIGMQKSIKEAKLLIGIRNKGLLAEGTTQGSGSINQALARLQKIAKDRNINPDVTNQLKRPSSGNIQQQLTSGSPGMVQLSPRGRGESYPAYFNRIMQTYGARKENGYWIMDEDTFRKIPTSNARREVAQMLLTQLDQGVKGSFTKEKNIKNLKMNEALARYNKKYAARADLHHGYPTVIGIEFFLGIPYMGDVWKRQIARAAKYGNFPGQPMVEGRTNLVPLPSSIPSTKTRKWGPVTKVKYPNPAYKEAADRLEKMGLKVPQHIHQIIHDSFLANEMGQRGQKFWAKWDPIIMKAGNKEQAWADAWEDFNQIIARNREMYNEAMSQLEAIFSNNPLSENPAKIVDMLEQYIADGKVTIGKGIVRDKNGKLVILKKGTKTALSKKKTVEYSQDAVKYELEEALRDFKKDIRQKRIEQDPRYKDVVEEIEYFPKLTFEEMTRMEELLYDIRTYNKVYVETNFNGRKTYGETKITKAQHKANLKEYYDLWHPKLFKLFDTGKPKPKITNIRKLQTTTHRDAKIGLGEETQLILDFPVQQLDIFNDLL